MNRLLRLGRAWLQVASMAFRAWPLGAAAVFPIFVTSKLVDGPLIAFALRFIVDGFAAGDTVTAGIWLAVLVVSVSSTSAIGTASSVVQDELAFRVPQEVNRRLMDASLAPAGIDHLENPKYADQMQVVRSHQDVPSWVFGNLAALTSAVLSLSFAVVVLATVHPVLVLVVIAVLPTVWVKARALRKELQYLDEGAPGLRLAQKLADLTVSPTAGKEVRILGLLDHLLAEHRRVSEAALRLLTRARIIHVWSAGLGGLLQGVALGGGLALLVWLAMRGQASAGEVVMGVGLLRALLGDAHSLTQKMGRIVEQGFLAERYLWLLEYRSPVVVRDDPEPTPSKLSEGVMLDHLSFTYPGTERRVLDDVTLTLPAGTTVALVGENGSGKTTLVKLLLRLYDPNEGRILVDGIDLRDLDPRGWRAEATAAFQDYLSLHLLAQEAIGLGQVSSIDDQQRVTSAAVDGGAASVVASLPDRYATQLGREFPGGVELSVGQWQKVALSRARMRPDPLFVVLDEPTSALDPRAEHEVFERFRTVSAASRARGGVALLVSHRFSTVRMADVIAVLDAGRIVESGAHDQLVAAGGLYAELYTAQARAYR